MQKLSRNHSVALCCGFFLVSLFMACSKQKLTDQKVLNISFQQSADHHWPPFSSQFELTRFMSHPAAVGVNNEYMFTKQMTCFDGKAVLAEGDQSLNSKIYLCFTINERPSTMPSAQPLHTGTFPVTTHYVDAKPGQAETYLLFEVNTLVLELTESITTSQEPRERKVMMQNQTAQGTIEITFSDKDRIAGKIDVKDGNLSITGAFDCPNQLAKSQNGSPSP